MSPWLTTFPLGVLLLISLGVASPAFVGAATATTAKVAYQPLPKPGEKISLDSGYYFTYGFEKPPKLGMAIMRVEIFDRGGKRDNSFVVKGDADMPSMRGAHGTGGKDFSLSTRKVYLLPVNLVMPGGWEIRFTFLKNGKTTFRGAYLFEL